MSAYRLLLEGTPGDPLATSDFLWRRPRFESSFHTKVGPHLQGLGRVPSPYIDLVRLAVGVYLVDRTAKRPTTGVERWSRDLNLEVPVIEPDRWTPVAESIADLVSFLSGDDWEFSFVPEPRVETGAFAEVESCSRVVLFSGGADSFCGALLAAQSTPDGLRLASHWDSTVQASSQRRAARNLRRLLGSAVGLTRVRIGRRTVQLGTSEPFNQEPSSRSRSFLFLALGLAVASARNAEELWIPENGFVSLNVPLTPERRAALSTRTTHPGFLEALGCVLRAVEIVIPFSNPLEGQTKGEVFRDTLNTHGDVVIQALSQTHSCAKSGANYAGFPPSTHCGVCYACLVRRGAFIAAGISDPTTYIEASLQGAARETWLGPQRALDIEAVAAATERGFHEDDIIELGLPERIRLADALSLARRGLAELSRVQIP